MQSLGLIILLLGLVLAVSSSSLSVFLFGLIFLACSVTLALAGTILTRKDYVNLTSKPRPANYSILGMLLLLVGVALILASNIAYFYTYSQIENVVYTDIGATISAYGCVISAHAYRSFH